MAAYRPKGTAEGKRPARILGGLCRFFLAAWLLASSAAPAVSYAAAGPSTAITGAPGGPPSSPGNPLAALPDPQGAARPSSGLPRAAGPEGTGGPGAGQGPHPRLNLAAGDENWSALGIGMNGGVYALAVDSSGNLYAGGAFTSAGGVSANRIAKWDPATSAWSALGSGVNGTVRALALDASGNLYAGGNFTSAGDVANTSYIARWDGATWSALGIGMNTFVFALATSGGNLYAGGNFTSAGGVANTSYIARWDGATWSALGSGTSGDVRALALDPSGNLYAGGYFTSAGGVAASNVAKWDPVTSAWSALGSGINGAVQALALDASGNLYAGGSFSSAGGVANTSYLARWDGATWSALGSWMSHAVYALATSGGNLYAGGNFTMAGGVAANRMARWDGSAWSALGSGMGNIVWALAIAATGKLYAGGVFTIAGGAAANRIAAWRASSTTSLSSSPNPSSFGQSVTFTATVTSTVGTPTGNLAFKEGATTLATAALSSGTATYYTSTLSVGTHSVTAEYGGDSNFNASTSSALSQTVNKASSTTALSSYPNPSSFGQSVTFTATVTSTAGTPTGNVAFVEGATTLATAALSGGVATYSTSALSAGAHSISAEYGGDSSFNASTSSALSQVVNAANAAAAWPQTFVPYTYSDGSPILDPARDVNPSYTDISSGVDDGVGTLPSVYTASDGTNFFFRFRVRGDPAKPSAGGFESTAYSVAIGVNGVQVATVGLDGKSPSTDYVYIANADGSSVEQVYATPFTGSSAGARTLSDGAGAYFVDVQVPISRVTAAAPSVTASTPVQLFFGTSQAANLSVINKDYMTGSSVSFTGLAVSRLQGLAATATSLSSSPNPSVLGQTVTFTATVASAGGTPTGNVAFKEGTSTLATVALSGGTATFSTSGLSVAAHSITAEYAGDSSFNASTSPALSQGVGGAATTATSLSSSLNPSTFSQSVTFTATVTSTAGTPTGNVAFKEGATTLATAALSGGTATFSTSGLSVASHSITAEYAGDSNFSASASSALSQVVNKADTSTALSSLPNPSTFGQSVAFTATVTSTAGTPTGNVAFKEGATTLATAALSGGVATYSTSSLSVASHSITAEYAGDSNFSASASSALSQGVMVSAAAAPWPEAWSPYTYLDGSPIRDPGRDVSPGYADVSSGAEKGVGSLPSLYTASDGSNVFFRFRLHGDPSRPTHGGFESTAYLVAMAVNGVQVATVGLDGKSPQTDYVYVASADGGAVDPVYATPFSGAGAGARSLSDGAGGYFLDFQAPISRITARAPAVKADTPVQLFFGTSQAANLSVINKDYVPGESVDFSKMAVTRLQGVYLSLTVDRSLVSGPHPPEVGRATAYDLALTAANVGSGALQMLRIGDTIPAGVTLLSAGAESGTIGVSGQAVNWALGSLSPGARATATLRVSVSPAPAQAGQSLTLNTGASGSGVQAVSGQLYTAASNALQVGPVANPVGTLAGTVTALAGTPLAGVTVRIYDSQNNLAATATTGADGAYSVPNLLAGGYRVSFTRSGYLEVSAKPEVERGATVTANAALSPLAGSLAGTVTSSATGRAAPGATVQLLDSAGAVITSTASIATGQYSFSDVPPEASLGVRASHPDYVSMASSLPVRLGAGGSAVAHLKLLPRPGALAGFVTDRSTGLALPGALVALYDANRNLVATALAGGEGRYTLSAVGEGTYTVEATRGTVYRRGASQAVVAPNRTTFQDLALSTHEGTLYGRVSEAGGETPQAPIAGATVTLLDGDGRTLASATADNLGEYYFLDLVAGAYTVAASAPWHSSGSGGKAAVYMPAAGSVYRGLSLLGNLGSISGRVADSRTGASLPGVTARLYDSYDNLAGYATSDAAGAFAFESVQVGSYKVFLSKAGYLDGTISAQVLYGRTSQVSGPLSPRPGSIWGMVKSASTTRALVGADVSLKDASGGVLATAQSDASGRYAFPQTAPGDYTVAAGHPDYQTGTRGSAQVALSPGGSTAQDLFLSPRPSTVSGRVTSAATG